MAPTAFDPYHKWLGIPLREQPPNHYRLLGLARFESDPDVIDAADRQMAYIAQCATGQHAGLSQKLLNELSAARICLLTAAKKAAYDARLREETEVHTLEPAQSAWSGPDLRELETPRAPAVKRAASRQPVPVVPLVVAGVCVLALGAIAIAFFSGSSKPTEVVQSDEKEQPTPSIKRSPPRPKREIVAETPNETTEPVQKSTIVASPEADPGAASKEQVAAAPKGKADPQRSTPQLKSTAAPRPKPAPVRQIVSDDDRPDIEWLIGAHTPRSLALWVQIRDVPEIASIREVKELPPGKLRLIAAEFGYQPNPISQETAEKLAGLISLQDLNLGQSLVAEGVLPQLSKCAALEALSVNVEKLSDEDLHTLESFPKLRRLALRGANLPMIDLGFLPQLSQLAELDLTGFHPVANALKPLQKCEKLEALAMNSGVQADTWDDLAEVKSLRRLELGYPIQLENFSDINKLKQVGHLRLVEYFKDEHIQVLKDALHLEALDLALPNISDEAIASLSQLPKLKYLGVQGNRSMKMFGSGWNSLRALSGFQVNSPPGFLESVRKRFPDLAVLDWTHSYPFGSDEYAAISRLTKLRDLRFSPVQGPQPELVEHLQALKNLKHVEVSGNITAGWQAKLAAAFPESQRTLIDVIPLPMSRWELSAIEGLEDESPFLTTAILPSATPPNSTPNSSAGTAQPAPPVTPPPIPPNVVPTDDYATAQWISGYQPGCRMLWFHATSRTRYLNEYTPGTELRNAYPDKCRLTVVDLYEIAPQTLPDEFSTALAKLPFLTGLRFDKAQLTDSGLEKLTQCAGLTRLHFSCQQLSEKSLIRLGEFKNLQSLELTEIRDAHVTKFPQLPTVTRVVLDGSQLSSTGLKVLKKMPRVQQLVLRGIKLDDSAVAVLGSMQSVVSLDLEGVTVDPLAMRKIVGPKRLMALRLASEDFTDEHLAQLRSFTSLSLMALKDTAVTDQGLESLATLPKLASLKIVGGKITGTGFEVEKKGWTQLAVVELDRLPLTSEGLSSLGRRALSLSTLIIPNAVLDDACMNAISRAIKLTSLRLPGTVTDDQILKLRSLASLKYLMVPTYSDRASRLEKSFPSLRFQSYIPREVQDLD